jgi:fructose-1-phosphate kinase PfkB-like protein
LLKERNANTILDTSGEALVYGCQAGPYLVKPNTTEARELTGLRIETIPESVRASQYFIDMGSGNVIISNGPNGALLNTIGRSIFAHSPEVQEKNPIGAGDAMIGGIVQNLSHGLSLEEAFRYGVACGAAAASLSGTSLGSLQLIENLVPLVQTRLVE